MCPIQPAACFLGDWLLMLRTVRHIAANIGRIVSSAERIGEADAASALMHSPESSNIIKQPAAVEARADREVSVFTHEGDTTPISQMMSAKGTSWEGASD